MSEKDDNIATGEYSTGDFTLDPLETGDLAQFEILERTLGEESDDTDSGVIAGKYRLNKVIGQGGMGKIYLATQRNLNRTVAIKVMLAPDDPEATRRFEAEASVTASLTHPNTIRIFDFGTTKEGFLYLVMEHLKGDNIKDYLKKQGAFSPLSAAKLISEICGALREAHNMGLVHRDIKPGNIMLVSLAEGELCAKLLDFGLVKSLEGSLNRTRTGIVLGSPMYMSPEQIESQPVSPASDIYSLGLTLYHMLSNSKPFQGESLTGILTAHLLRYPKPLWEVAPELANYPGLIWIVNRALQKRMEDRFRSAGQMKKALDAFIQNPKCGFIFADGELQITEKFIYDNQNDKKNLKLNRKAGAKGILWKQLEAPVKKFRFSWLVGFAMVAIGLFVMISNKLDQKRVEPQKTVVTEAENDVTDKKISVIREEKEEKEEKERQEAQEEEEAVAEIVKPLPERKITKQATPEKENDKSEPVETPKNSKKKSVALEKQAGSVQTEEAVENKIETAIESEKPQRKTLDIQITTDVGKINNVKLTCGSYSETKNVTGVSLRFSGITEERCDLRFKMIDLSIVKAKGVLVKSSIQCAVTDAFARCN